jgi:glyoxylase-like metal-dependent hydrolase (beta-lactamase superfamily II)
MPFGLARAALAALCGLALATPAFSAAPPSSLPSPRQLARDVYVFPGKVAAPGPDNLGRVANVGVIVGPEGVIVVGTGTSDAEGERLLAAIGRLSKRPVVLAINTHAAPEHVLGNSAFTRRGIAILAHRATDEYMAANCERCLHDLQILVGERAMARSHLERPRQLIDGAISIKAGGRHLEILHYGPTQQAGSIAVFDATSGVLFAGGLASFDIVPDAHDADLANWIKALEQMRRLPLKRVVPGRGPAGEPDRLAEVEDYLAALAQETRHAYDDGLGLTAATANVDIPRYRSWTLYAQTHRRNVHFQYLRMEAQEFATPAAANQ